MMRKSLLVLLAGSLLMVWAGVAVAEEFNWRRFEGTKIRALLGQSAYTQFEKKTVEDFEKLTGIKVETENLSAMALRRKVVVELAAKNEDLDVMQGMMKTMYMWDKAGWLAELDAYLKDPKLTPADWDYDDFFEKVLIVNKGRTVGLPGSTNPQVLMYRKDLFEKYGVEVPTTKEELEAAAKKLTLDTNGDGRVDIYGWIARQAESEVTAPFANFLYSNGAAWLDEEGRPAFNSPAAVEAMEFYGKLGRLYGPAGGSRIGWQTVISTFGRGQAAMTVEVSIFAKLQLEKKLKGKIGYALVPPMKPGNQVMIIPVNTYHISAASKKKEAAWFYTMYTHSKEVSKAYQMLGLPTARKSCWEDPEVKANDTLPELSRIQYAGFAKGKVGFEIPIAGFMEVRPILGRLIYTAYEGGNVQAAADKAVEEVNAIMERTDK